MNYTLPTSIRLPRNLKDFLQRRADSENRKLSQMIIHVLEMYRSSMIKRGKKPPAAVNVETHKNES